MVREEKLKSSDVDKSYKGKTSRFEDLTGQVFGNLTMLGVYRKEGGTIKWVAECTCGNIIKTTRNRVKQRGKRSCVDCTERDMIDKVQTPIKDKIETMKTTRPDLTDLKPFGTAWSNDWEVTCTFCKETFRRRYRDLLRGVKGCSCRNMARKGLDNKALVIDDYCKEYGYKFHEWVQHRGHISAKLSCNMHGGIFTSMFENLKKGKIPCNSCRKEKYTPYNLKSQDQFIKESTDVHGDLYNYSLVKYERSGDKVDIICNRCERVFQQAPAAHISGKGCSDCASYGFRPSKECWVYIMRLEGLCEEWYKVGITLNLKGRLYSVAHKSWYDVEYLDAKKFSTGKEAIYVEGKILKELKTTNTIDPRYHADGRTEIFKPEELPTVERLLEEYYLESSLQRLQDNN
jgi:hypothetical protein